VPNGRKKQNKKKTIQINPTDLLNMSEASVGSTRRSGTGELHATLAKHGVKRVGLGNFDGDALAVTKVALVKKLTIVRATRH
jgi:hypothetical protein